MAKNDMSSALHSASKIVDDVDGIHAMHCPEEHDDARSQLRCLARKIVSLKEERATMWSKWRASFERSQTAMNVVVRALNDILAGGHQHDVRSVDLQSSMGGKVKLSRDDAKLVEEAFYNAFSGDKPSLVLHVDLNDPKKDTASLGVVYGMPSEVIDAHAKLCKKLHSFGITLADTARCVASIAVEQSQAATNLYNGLRDEQRAAAEKAATIDALMREIEGMKAIMPLAPIVPPPTYRERLEPLATEIWLKDREEAKQKEKPFDPVLRARVATMQAADFIKGFDESVSRDNHGPNDGRDNVGVD